VTSQIAEPLFVLKHKICITKLPEKLLHVQECEQKIPNTSASKSWAMLIYAAGIEVLTGPDETQEHHRGCASTMKPRNEFTFALQWNGDVQIGPRCSANQAISFKNTLRYYGPAWSTMAGLLPWGYLLNMLLHPLQRKLSNNPIIQPNNSGKYSKIIFFTKIRIFTKLEYSEILISNKESS